MSGVAANYEMDLFEGFQSPEGSRAELEALVKDGVSGFTDNKFCRAIYDKTLTLDGYHRILTRIFPQVYASSNTFALAGAKCAPRQTYLRDYLFTHSEEEKLHWTWILKDLESTGYTGPDPRKQFPLPCVQAYIAFNYYIAEKTPVARLAIALMLESLGGNHGKHHATLMKECLKVEDKNLLFFFGHGDTDVGHTADIWEVLDNCKLSPEEWGWMVHSTKTAYHLYKAIYNEWAEK